ncbi:hypothetical protein [Sandarakinorhabdus sp.]|uniref:hypothetical protein n=1 Tax=Sandarakinorhabdus sp. TaxID=1916663 RepID=UPI0035624463
MTADILLVLILVPVFVIVLQKYIEFRAIYAPPSEKYLLNFEKTSGAISTTIVKAIPTIRIAMLGAEILLLYVFGFFDEPTLKWSAIGGVDI